MKIYKILFSHLIRYWRKIIATFILSLIFSITTLVLPFLIKQTFQNAVIEKNKLTLLTTVTLFMIAIVIRSISEYYKDYFMSYVGQKVIFDLRNKLFSHLQLLDLNFYTQQKSGTLLSSFINDIMILNSFVSYTIVNLLTEPMVLIGSLIFLFYLHWKLALLSLIIGPFAIYTILSLGKQMKNFTFRLQQKMADITHILQEVIFGVKIVKAFAMEKNEIKKFEQQNRSNFLLSLKTLKILILLPPLVEFLGALSIAFMMWYGGNEVIKGNLSFGALIAFILYLGTVSRPIRTLGGVHQRIQQTLAAGERIFSILDTKPEIVDTKNAISLPKIQGEVAFKNVFFCYEKEMVLKNINFTASCGEIIALVGPSGSGKTTLINLLLRFYDPSQGEITIDGYNIKKLKKQNIREQIGLVTQETILFSGTIKENILYGNPSATFEEIEKAAEIANAHIFISQLPEKYNTEIGEKGVKLSGGQKQRIAIARAIIRNPRILILDEATSALDTESEKLIQEALNKIIHQQTTFIIAHRLSTITEANKIIVLNKGEILNIGTHQELLETSDLYKKLVEMQFDLKLIS